MPEVPVPVDARDQPAGSVGGGIADILKPDPTANVRALIALEVKRMDDLRSAESRRNDELRAAESRRVDEQAALRSSYDEKLRDAEAKRIDAIRVVDVNAVAVANERANAQAAVLATQVQVSAEQLRAIVATSASTLAQQLVDTLGPINTRITTLERVSYEGQGKSTVADPALAQLTAVVTQLAAAQATGAGRGAGSTATVAYVLAGLGGIGTILGIVAAIVAFSR